MVVLRIYCSLIIIDIMGSQSFQDKLGKNECGLAYLVTSVREHLQISEGQISDASDMISEYL